jgi:hypothetical protein
MHFSTDFRLALTRGIKRLLSDDNWDDEDSMPQEDSFLTLLKCILVLNTKKAPSIGSDGQGSLSATWVAGSNRLTLECYNRDLVFLVLSRDMGAGKAERVAAHTSVGRLSEVLSPFNPEVWFD